MTGAQNPGRLNTVAEFFYAAFTGAVGSKEIQLKGEKNKNKHANFKEKIVRNLQFLII